MSRLALKQSKLKRKLVDNLMSHGGYTGKVLKLSISEDRYHDEEVSFNPDKDIKFVTAVIEFPNKEIPIFNTEGYTKGINIYDLLPINAYFKFSDNIKKGDIIIIKYLLSPDNPKDYKLNILQIVESLGLFSNVMLMNKFHVAPFQLDIEHYPDVMEQVANWEDEGIK
jgi:hypothetical protein